MVRLREIPRTATFAWSPGAQAPLIATGTRAGAVDADFSSETQLEIWDLALDTTGQTVELQPVASIGADSRFHDIAWSQASEAHSRGIIAGGLDSGALDLWDAAKLLSNDSTPLISRAEKHSGAIKALQFNPFRPELLATAGAKGELYITDINNAATSFRLGTSAARADDFDAVDWNKKVPHILATGSSGGFVTVWDVKTKKENLTLNNLGRKPVSAVAWDPNVATDLITATPSNTDPLILVWDLRNSNAPKQTLKAHEQGVLSLSWCRQDADLLLSCGQDNRTICWNPHTGQTLGEFPIVTNWTFQTRFHPHNPHLLATASFDGKIAVQTLQNTRKDAEKGATPQTQALDGEDFFAKARTEPQGATFSLPQAPKWLQRPVGVSFGFGGKLVKLSANEPGSAQMSKISISTFAVDSAIGSATETFEKSLSDGDVNGICEAKIANARTEEEKADWTVMSTLISGNARKQLVEYLGFEDVAATEDPTTNGTTAPKDEASFFEGTGEGDNFLSDLAATKGARTNNPFKVYTGDEKEADRNITQALIQGKFERALDICLKENRLSDAFMIAICGGQKCIDKAQAAYFKRKSDGPNYLRLLASVVGKNLWDVVHNANLDNWKEVMATLCTYADESEFPDLCEALGDRLEEAIAESADSKSLRKDATFCYLAGSKLEKVVVNWVEELQEHENAGLEQSGEETSFSIHAKSLQDFIEKVTVFRQVTSFKDPDLNKEDEFKLAPLYSKYTEYADVVAAHGQLQVAEKYLDLLPAKYPAAEIARNRVKFATRRAAPAAQKQLPATAQRGQRVAPTYTATQPASIPAPQNPMASAYAPPSQQTPSPYAPAGFQQPQQPQQPPQPTASPYAPAGVQQSTPAYGAAPGRSYTPAGYQQPGAANPGIPQAGTYGGYGSAAQMPPPPRNFNESPAPPPAANNKNIPDWNDTPDFGPRKAPPRRGTPGFANPYGAQPGVSSPPQVSTPGFGGPKPTPPPPPKGPPQGPPRVGSPAVQQGIVPPPRPSSAANTYAPPATPSSFAPHMQPPRTSSPYNPPPGAAAPSNRYAPAPGLQPSPAPGGMPPPRQVAPPPNPYGASPYAAQPPSQPQAPPAQAPRGPPQGPPRAGPPGGPPQGPPQAAPISRPGTAQSGGAATPAPKYPPGDRSHIPASAANVYQTLHAEMQRVKSKAPASFVQQVNDVEKRINILFDHLNNEQVVKPDTIAQLDAVAQAIQNRDHAGALGVINEVVKGKTEEGTAWMVGVQRLIKMSKATPF